MSSGRIWTTARAFVLVGVVFASGLMLGVSTSLEAAEKGRNPYRGLDTFARAFGAIEANYVDDVEPAHLVQGAIGGMVGALDPHSVYLDPDGYRQLRERTEGRYYGIGVELGTVNGRVAVTRVTSGGPADLGGVRPSDVVVTVDGTAVDGRSLADVSEAISGPRGAPVDLGLDRAGMLLEVVVVRDQILVPAVSGALFAPGWAYVRIEHFRQRTAAEVRKKLADLEAAGKRPLLGLVLDLRDNPGGLLEEAVSVVDMFVGQGTIVTVRGKTGSPDESHPASPSADDLTMPLVLLINGQSASASEIVAGALRDLGRATLVGGATYGKGSVQQVYEFEDGSALKLTVARYYLPSGDPIEDHVGVKPNVPLSLVSPRATASERLRKAIEAAAGAGPDRKRLLDLVGEIETQPEEATPAVPWEGTLVERLAADPQLEAAWKAVRDGP